MTIRYLSFDFDGCLFNSAYVALPHNNFTKDQTDAVLVKNREFLEKLKTQNAGFSAAYGLIGSTRQDYITDLMNCGIQTRFKGSCCPAIATVCDYLGITFEPLMLADIEGELESGTSYQRIMDEIKNGTWSEPGKTIHEHAGLVNVDECKRTILFAQMQKAAADHPGEEIIFDFFDDRPEILGALEEYFTKYPHMIPKNVGLRLHSYAGETALLVAAIPGTGNPISNYQLCVRTMHKNLNAMNEVAEALKDFALTTRPEEKIFSIVKELAEKGLFLESSEEAKAFFVQNPNAPFVAHPSRRKVDDLFLFTVSYPTSKGIVASRYGLDFAGKLFLVDDETKRFEIEMDPQGLAATLAIYVEHAKNIVETTEDWDKPVMQTPESKPEEVSKGEALYQELTMSPYFVADANKAKAVLAANPEFPFVIRKSGTPKEGMITFTTVFDTSKGLVSTRFGLNNQGDLFVLDNKGAHKITDVSEDLLGILTKQTLTTKVRVNRAENLGDVTFRDQNTTDSKEETNQTGGVLAAEKGFFAPKLKQPTGEHPLGHDMQP
ncbi:Dot/Icm secretion system substrate [Legionella steigerwaltii]|uniref:Dot/Icm T4SS effector n=1 Tax=Legionella steigerwaltii TaxID=460 RepID=A0A378LBR7_9GAMM|nr:hypothetical protein [Legionella steigerwaltii]KTD78495.1 Dot/Icm T4SS effector [Legionella steigerwaltii]STY24147.1 Dot/Icm secretion system substrate [Legionella steigerwaltii]